MGKRYTKEEKHLIQELSQQGHSDETIAQQLGRSTNAIRNIRHRNNIKTKTTKTIQQLKETTHILELEIKKLEKRLTQLSTKQKLIQKANKTQDQTLRNKIEEELTNLKQRKPELFYITKQDQINQLTTQLATSIIRWLIE